MRIKKISYILHLTPYTFLRGQGLMEMIVAIGVITTGLVTILALAASSLSGAKESEARTVALSLAREGVEVIRNIRDSNWLVGEGVNWDDGLHDGTDHTAVAKFDKANNLWMPLDFGPDNFEDGKTQFYLTDGVYIQGEFSPPLSARPTFYRRLLTLDEICENDTIQSENSSCVLVGSPKVGIRVTSRVEWTEHERKHSMVAEDRLYNWK